MRTPAITKESHLRGIRGNGPKLQVAVNELDIRLAIIGFEDQLRGVGEDQPNAGGHQDLHEVRLIAHRPDEDLISAIAEDEKQQAGRNKAEIGIDLKYIEQDKGGVHPHHQKCAVRKIHDSHNAKDQRQPHADERIERPGQQTVRTCL